MATDWTTGDEGSIPGGGKEDIFCILCVHSGSGSYPAPCRMGTGGKAWSGRDAGHSPPSSSEVVNEYNPYLLSPVRLHRCVMGLL
jgi:hypothetical protein